MAQYTIGNIPPAEVEERYYAEVELNRSPRRSQAKWPPQT